MIPALSVLCIVFNLLYFIHSIKEGNRNAAFGTAVMMLITAAHALTYAMIR